MGLALGGASLIISTTWVGSPHLCGEHALEVLKLLDGGQLAKPQQVHQLLEADPPCEVIEVVAAVKELTVGAINVADARFGRPRRPSRPRTGALRLVDILTPPGRSTSSWRRPPSFVSSSFGKGRRKGHPTEALGL